MRGATPQEQKQYEAEVEISIHAPHAGRDIGYDGRIGLYVDISIHAPHAGRDFWHLV